jgi:hypothetical protein
MVKFFMDNPLDVGILILGILVVVLIVFLLVTYLVGQAVRYLRQRRSKPTSAPTVSEADKGSPGGVDFKPHVDMRLRTLQGGYVHITADSYRVSIAGTTVDSDWHKCGWVQVEYSTDAQSAIPIATEGGFDSDFIRKGFGWTDIASVLIQIFDRAPTNSVPVDQESYVYRFVIMGIDGRKTVIKSNGYPNKAVGPCQLELAFRNCGVVRIERDGDSPVVIDTDCTYVILSTAATTWAQG